MRWAVDSDVYLLLHGIWTKGKLCLRRASLQTPAMLPTPDLLYQQSVPGTLEDHILSSEGQNRKTRALAQNLGSCQVLQNNISHSISWALAAALGFCRSESMCHTPPVHPSGWKRPGREQTLRDAVRFVHTLPSSGMVTLRQRRFWWVIHKGGPSRPLSTEALARQAELTGGTYLSKSVSPVGMVLYPMTQKSLL